MNTLIYGVLGLTSGLLTGIFLLGMHIQNDKVDVVLHSDGVWLTHEGEKMIEIIDFIKNPTYWDQKSLFQTIMNIHGKTYGLKSLDEAQELVIQVLGIDKNENMEIPKSYDDEIHRAIEFKRKYFANHLPGSVKVFIFALDPSGSQDPSRKRTRAFANEQSIFLAINPKEDIQNEVFYVLIHELNHVIRYQFSYPHEKFLDWLILEGLAGLFEKEMFPEIDPGEHFKQDVDLAKSFLPKVKTFWRDPTFMKDPEEADQWFFGSEKANIPRYLGYTLGFLMVEKARKERFQHLPWNEFIQLDSERLVE